MQVKFNESNTRLQVIRDIGDPKFGKKESWFYYRVNKELKKLGYNTVKKLAWKDGHLVDDNMYYIREKKGNWQIYDDMYAIRLISSRFDELGTVFLVCEGKLL